VTATCSGASVGASTGDVLLTAMQIRARIAELAAEIERDFAGGDLVLVGALATCTALLSDLSQALRLPHALDLIELEPFGAAEPAVALVPAPRPARGTARILEDIDLDLRDRDVLLVDCVADTGLTLACLLRHLEGHAPRTLAAAVLLDRPYRRLVHDLPLRYVGFAVADGQLAGYGLAGGSGGPFRHLPDIHFRQLV
jgi:hypoxanthine phosphoribosyltransferase